MSGTRNPKAPDPFETVIPILRVRDLDASLEFYVSVLGFGVDWKEPGIIASVSRGGRGFMLAEGDQGNFGGWIFIGVHDVEGLFEELEANGAKFRMPPTNYPWGYELQVEDPDGNVLRFAAEPREGEPIGEWLDMRGVRWAKTPAGGWKRVEA